MIGAAASVLIALSASTGKTNDINPGTIETAALELPLIRYPRACCGASARVVTATFLLAA
jgi:hypothetical protein